MGRNAYRSPASPRPLRDVAAEVGAQVRHGAEDGRRLRQRVGRPLASDPEVDDDRRAVLPDEQVVALQVAVDDFVLVQHAERVGHLQEDAADRAQRRAGLLLPAQTGSPSTCSITKYG